MGLPREIAPGTVVLVRFPFSDLSGTKLRPAVVLTHVGREDYILAQVTSRPYGDPKAIEIKPEGFQRGGLERSRFVRPGKLFTANNTLMVREVGVLSDQVMESILDSVVALFGR